MSSPMASIFSRESLAFSIEKNIPPRCRAEQAAELPASTPKNTTPPVINSSH